ncbi:MAG TPA: hypothetical protein PLE77_09115 [Kiritimatiellia bacterium]|nr:hypothetical protein [Kiritimatiellia bacterium]
MSKKQLSKEAVLEALKSSNATSLTALHKAMGGTGSVPGSTAKRMRELVPDIEKRLEANKGEKIQPTTAKRKSTKALPSPKYPRHLSNPYRERSSYGLCYDILASQKEGIRRDELIGILAKEGGTTTTRAGFNTSVVLSPRESATGPRHRSARQGYFVRVTNDHVQLIVGNAGKDV